MKRFLLSLGLFFQPWDAFGQRSIYSFSGHISNLFYDGGGILAARNVTVGDPVSVSYAVDFGSPGYFLLNDGNVELPTNDPLGNVYMRWFYCHLASGSLFPEENGGLNNRPQDVAEYFTGWNRSDPVGNTGILWGGGADSYFTVSKDGFSGGNYVEEWQVGTPVRGTIVAYSDKDWSIAWADMRLDSIEPVPEPRSVLLFTIGAVLVWHRRRKAA